MSVAGYPAFSAGRILKGAWLASGGDSGPRLVHEVQGRLARTLEPAEPGGFGERSNVTAACNRAHPAKQRLARWLLLIGDRTGLHEIPMTQESLSAMLGVRRESITRAASGLRDAGAIEYRRARVDVTDRDELKRHSCSCYPSVTASYVRFLISELPGTTPKH